MNAPANGPCTLPILPGTPPPAPEGLWQRYHQQSDPQTESELIEQHLPLVKTVVGRLAMTLPAHVHLDDLQSAGLVGLLQAVRRYNPACGASFATYARLRIRGAVLDELRRMDWVPRPVHDKARKIQNAIGLLEQRLGRVPSEAQVAQALHISPEVYQCWLEEIRPLTFVCLDAAINPASAEGASHHDSVADDSQASPDEQAARQELIELILERLQQLPDSQRKVLALYYFEDMRLREIAAVLGVTQSRVSQIHAQAILALRAYLARRERNPQDKRMMTVA